ARDRPTGLRPLRPDAGGNQNRGGLCEIALLSMRQELHDDDAEHARVSAAQQFLLPESPRAVCAEVGLNWWAALKLHEDGWLSFNPETTPQLDEAKDTELRFVGSLVAAGCDSGLLHQLLDSLSKPYSYRGSRIYYDWSTK